MHSFCNCCTVKGCTALGGSACADACARTYVLAYVQRAGGAVHTCTHALMHSMYPCTNAPMHLGTYVHTHPCTFVHMRLCSRVHTRPCTYAYMHSGTYAHMHLCTMRCEHTCIAVIRAKAYALGMLMAVHARLLARAVPFVHA